MRTHILITDDEPLIRKSLKEILCYEGYDVSTAEDGVEALKIMSESSVDVVMADIKMPRLNGLELLREVKKLYPRIPVVLMSAYGNIEKAVEAMRLGAYDYVTKPIEDRQLKQLLEKMAQEFEIARNGSGNAKVARRAPQPNAEAFYHVVGADEKMRRIYTMIESIADSPSTVLIYGESGTGKRMVAQAIHKADPTRCDKPFIEVSCGALPETLLESELFGHIKGSFTGAVRDRAGRFELADGGTLLLDEIDTCSSSLQVKLLRVLEEGSYERVGDTQTMKSDVRVIAATNQNLEELVRRNGFRGDLYWRLNVISIQLPPLRERTGDIALLINHFLEKYNVMRERSGKPPVLHVAPEAMEAILRYPWPGNIRELENTIERACILVRDDTLRFGDLPDSLLRPKADRGPAAGVSSVSLKEALRDPERDIVVQALEHANWNCTRAAATLGINRTTLYNKMKLFSIKRGNGHG